MADSVETVAGRTDSVLRRLRGRCGLLGMPRFALLISSQVCSLLGDQLYLVALPFFVLAHATAADLGNVLLAFGLGRLCLLPLGGHLADRFARVRVIFVVYIFKAALLALLATSQPQRLWVVMALVALLGVTEGLSLPSTMSIVPQLVPETSLPAANSLLSTATMAISLVGPALAGVVVRLAGTAFTIDLDAVLALAAIGAIGALAVGQRRQNRPEILPKAGLRPAVRAIPSLLRSNEILRFSFIVTAIVASTYAGVTRIALPVYTTRTLHSGARDYGLLLTGFGIGGVAGAMAARGLFKFKRRGKIALSVGVAQGVVLVIVPLTGHLWFSFGALLLAGAAQAGLNVFFVTALQVHIRKTELGMAMSAVLMAALGGFPIAVYLAGHLVNAVGAAAIFAVGGLVMSIGFACGFLSREFRSL